MFVHVCDCVHRVEHTMFLHSLRHRGGSAAVEDGLRGVGGGGATVQMLSEFEI